MDLGEFRAILDFGPSPRASAPSESVDLGEFRTTLDGPTESVFPVR